jgi:two-component system response regulator TctD
LRELEARMRVLNRRYSHAFTCKEEIGDAVLDHLTRSIVIGDKSIAFCKREFRVLELLVSRLNKVIPKERLMNQLFDYEDDVGPNAVELYISRVRQKIRGTRLQIETVRSVGYVARMLGDERPPNRTGKLVDLAATNHKMEANNELCLKCD